MPTGSGSRPPSVLCRSATPSELAAPAWRRYRRGMPAGSASEGVPQSEGEGHLQRVTTMRYDERSDDVYDAWSDDYEADLVEGYGYVAPAVASEALLSVLADRDAEIIDYGCGTGLVGEELARRGFSTVDGADLSTGMLEIAATKGAYRKLITADLTAALDIGDAAYEALICVGVMGGGHMAPEHLPELMRTIRSGGPAVFFMNGTTYDRDGYRERFAALEREGAWIIHREERVGYMTELENRPGMLLVATKP